MLEIHKFPIKLQNVIREIIKYWNIVVVVLLEDEDCSSEPNSNHEWCVSRRHTEWRRLQAVVKSLVVGTRPLQRLHIGAKVIYKNGRPQSIRIGMLMGVVF